MRQYFFVLGRNSTLSTAEIISVLNVRKISYSIKKLSPEICILSSNHSLDTNELMKTLGGTVKIGEILDEVGFDEDEVNFEKIFLASNLTSKYLPKREGKLHIGVSIYNAGGSNQYVAQLEKRLKEINLTIKENLKEKGARIGFVQIKGRVLSSVSVAKNSLLTQGAEFVLILSADKIMVGKTLAVQEFETFSFRDFFRPQKDKRSGIMPPKLARMMINLASINKNALLLDPFCGSGTILQEAIFLGFKNIIGCDISGKAISDTKENIDWLFKNFRYLNQSKFNLKLFSIDVRNISQKIPQNLVDAIITEPYLGPPMFKMPDLKTVERLLPQLSILYFDTFFQFAKIMKKGGKMVIIFPAFAIGSQIYFVPILEKIKTLGFKQCDIFPKELQNNPAINLTLRHSILYGGEEQFVKREILCFSFRTILDF